MDSPVAIIATSKLVKRLRIQSRSAKKVLYHLSDTSSGGNLIKERRFSEAGTTVRTGNSRNAITAEIRVCLIRRLELEFMFIWSPETFRC
jgi:hypothetical protein